MKICLVHDYLTRFGGAERVLAAMAEIWPEAPIFTSVVTAYPPDSLTRRVEDFKPDGFSSGGPYQLRTSCLQRLPAAVRASKLLTPLYPLVFENLDLSDFDVIISSGYFSKGVLTTPEQLHINYCHTVPRFLYGYPTETRVRESRLGRIITTPIDHKLRVWDFYSAQRPDFIIANSKTVAARIKKFWHRDSIVIHPPVEISSKFSFKFEEKPNFGSANAKCQMENDRYFLVVSRLEPYKNADLAIGACNKLNLPLKIVGEGSEKRRLEKLTGPMIELLGQVSNEERNQLYAGCRALIFPAQDEDFGIVPVEAMAYGKPVIALRSGGVTETVVENETGLFFNESTAESLAEAIQAFNQMNYFQTEECHKKCLTQARKFSKERFKKDFQEFVEKRYENLCQTNPRW